MNGVFGKKKAINAKTMGCPKQNKQEEGMEVGFLAFEVVPK